MSVAQLEPSVRRHNTPAARFQREEVQRHIGLRIRLRRQELGLGLLDVAALVGISYQQMQKYERAHNSLRVGTLMEIASVLDVSPGYFFEGIEASEKPAPAGDTFWLLRHTRAMLAIKSESMREAIHTLARIAAGGALDP